MICLWLLLTRSRRRRSVFVTYDLQDMHAKRVHENEWIVIFSDQIIIVAREEIKPPRPK